MAFTPMSNIAVDHQHSLGTPIAPLPAQQYPFLPQTHCKLSGLRHEPAKTVKVHCVDIAETVCQAFPCRPLAAKPCTTTPSSHHSLLQRHGAAYIHPAAADARTKWLRPAPLLSNKQPVTPCAAEVATIFWPLHASVAVSDESAAPRSRPPPPAAAQNDRTCTQPSYTSLHGTLTPAHFVWYHTLASYK
jgi:hypothetical protein